MTEPLADAVRRATEFLADPHAHARKFWADDPDVFHEAKFPFALGLATSLLELLLDSINAEHPAAAGVLGGGPVAATPMEPLPG